MRIHSPGDLVLSVEEKIMKMVLHWRLASNFVERSPEELCHKQLSDGPIQPVQDADRDLGR